ncbi:EamA family transporter [Amnibacterium sp. CER49]|uniref:EamA family transporter n=1 Tax=Amnibacterium sp. CER49 TaxID=3039161 RepID=UPI002446BC82|nr:EamA family transporter [Amnibacterium sp. CER49]MDH2442560.1 EamA family transporter [Amnibacterium sp. CER49]
MSLPDLCSAILCAVLWGFNFVVIAIGLQDFPPLLFASLRFLLAAVPAMFLVRRPGLGWLRVVLIGLLMSVLQFGALFVAMKLGIGAGLASVVIQSQVVFTALIGALTLRERPSGGRTVGLLIAVCGLCVIGIGASSTSSVAGFVLCLLAGLAWGGGNVLTRATLPARPFALLIYSSAVAPLPLLGLSLVTEGPASDLHALLSLNLMGVLALVYVSGGATLIGFGLWYRLLSRYPADSVAPFTVLVPIVGLLSAWAVLGQAATPTDLLGAAIAVAGLVVIHGWGARGGGRGSPPPPRGGYRKEST